jgi:hypothetical protein
MTAIEATEIQAVGRGLRYALLAGLVSWVAAVAGVVYVL